jgi:hypothetical protein
VSRKLIGRGIAPVIHRAIHAKCGQHLGLKSLNDESWRLHASWVVVRALNSVGALVRLTPWPGLKHVTGLQASQAACLDEKKHGGGIPQGER